MSAILRWMALWLGGWRHAKCRLSGRWIMHEETLTYEVDGLVMKSQLFFEPAAQKRAGVLVFPEIFGLSPHAIARAERLAAEGYVTLACDIHGNGTLLGALQEAIGLMGPLYADTNGMRMRRLAGLAALAAHPAADAAGLAAIGFCFGGTMSLELARGGADLKAVAGFHSGLSPTAPKNDARAVLAGGL